MWWEKKKKKRDVVGWKIDTMREQVVSRAPLDGENNSGRWRF